MSREISSELSMILNLKAASDAHRKHCKESDCGTSLYELKETARLIADKMRAMNRPKEELKEANRVISEMKC